MRRDRVSGWAVALGLAAVVGALLRVYVYRSTLGLPNSDEAVVGLMTLHALHGHLTTFYWGNSFGGPQEALLTVPLFATFGSGWLVLRIVPIVLSAVAAVLVWRVGRRTIGEPAAWVAGALFWVWPPAALNLLTHQPGFYASDVLYCALLLLLALRIVEQPDAGRVAWFGLVFGLAFWQTSQIVPVAAGVIAWTVVKEPRALRHLRVAVPLAVLGAMPWIVWNLRHGWSSLGPRSGLHLYAHSLRLFVSPYLPMMLGLRAPFSTQAWLSVAVVDVVLAVLVAAFALGAFRARRRDVSILYTVALVFPFVYALSAMTVHNPADPRYLMALVPVLVLLVAQVGTTFPRGVAVLALAAVVCFATLHRMNSWLDQPVAGFPSPSSGAFVAGLDPAHAHGEPIGVSTADIRALIATLDRLGISEVYSDYWAAYQLAFDTKERIVGIELKPLSVTFAHGVAVVPFSKYVRTFAYERRVQAARRQGFVFFAETAGGNPVAEQLERHAYRRYAVGPFLVLAPPARGQATGAVAP